MRSEPTGTRAEDCPACDSRMSEFDDALMLDRFPVEYFQCGACGLVCLPSPHWLDEAYASAITHSDTGLLRRSRILSNLTAAVIRAEGLTNGRFLDWAGGYGTLTQMMRDRGYDYWHHDDFADAVFARDFADDGISGYSLISAFEVVEHLAEPCEQLGPISLRTDRLLFSTLLLPEPTPRIADWWYYDPSHGQHITFHTVESLRRLGAKLGYELTSNGHNWHLFHRGHIRPATRVLLSPWVPRTKVRLRQVLAGAKAGR